MRLSLKKRKNIIYFMWNCLLLMILFSLKKEMEIDGFFREHPEVKDFYVGNEIV